MSDTLVLDTLGFPVAFVSWQRAVNLQWQDRAVVVTEDAKRVLLVGHEPQLGSFVANVLGREDETITLKKGACVALELHPEKDDKSAGFLWYLAPGKKWVSSFKKAFPQKKP